MPEYMHLITQALGKSFYEGLLVEGSSKEIGQPGNDISEQNVWYVIVEQKETRLERNKHDWIILQMIQNTKSLNKLELQNLSIPTFIKFFKGVWPAETLWTNKVSKRYRI